MGVGYNPRIVTNGMILCLDAGNRKSYPSSGTTWTDLSGNGNNGTLTNGPTFNDGNGGSIVFDGTNDYAEIAANSLLAFGTGNFTIDFCARITTIKGNQYFFDFGSNSVVLQYLPSGNPGILRFLTQTVSIKDTTYTLSENVVYNFTIVRNGVTGYLFINGTQLNSWSDSETYTSNSLKIGKYGGNSDLNLTGNVYYFRVYNRALSAQEVSQNFNALRGRYGI